ncbi:MAG: hypothetical protein WD342_06850 [Verrucomicrobiales bacterium]
MKLRDWARNQRWKLAMGAVLLVVAAGFAYVYRDELDREQLVAFGRNLPLVWYLLAFFVLPLGGVPITIFLVLAGLRFGIVGGMAVATAGVFFHNLVAFRLTHGYFREPVRNWLERHGWGIPAIPPKHRVWFTAVFAAVHGPPYAVKLYLLALTEIPLRIYLGVGAPVYAAFCIIPVGVGSAVMNFDPTWISVIIGLLAATWLLGYWLRRRFGDKAPRPRKEPVDDTRPAGRS